MRLATLPAAAPRRWSERIKVGTPAGLGVTARAVPAPRVAAAAIGAARRDAGAATTAPITGPA